MKAFVYFLTLRWIKLYRHLTSSDEALELQAFEDLAQQCVIVSPTVGASKYSIRKTLKKVMKGTMLLPLGIRVWPFEEASFSPEKVLDHFITSKGSATIVVTGKTFKKIFSNGGDNPNTRWTRYGALDFRESRSFSTVSGNVHLGHILRTKWYAVQQHLGLLERECNNCENDLEMSSNGRCEWCEIDVDTKNPRPETNAGLYEEIVKYEQESGKEVLSRHKSS